MMRIKGKLSILFIFSNDAKVIAYKKRKPH